jgi:hypothetical protein
MSVTIIFYYGKELATALFLGRPNFNDLLGLSTI